MGKLEGKVAVITAATSGMALATAKLFVKEGAHVFITGRRKKQLDEAVKAIGNNVTGIQGGLIAGRLDSKASGQILTVSSNIDESVMPPTVDETSIEVLSMVWKGWRR